MKLLIEIKISGDFEENLDEENIERILDAVICDGAESVCCTGSYVIKEIIEN